MKGIGFLTIALLAGGLCQAEPALSLRERSVNVVIDEACPVSGALLARSRQIAGRMLSQAGLRITWGHGRPKAGEAGERALAVRLAADTPPGRYPGALAVALPYEGAHITVFYDRVEAMAPAARAQLLAHVLVHEITHLLQGTDWHSEHGVMKATWSSADYEQMRRSPLMFTVADIALIHHGLDTWTNRQTLGDEGAGCAW